MKDKNQISALLGICIIPQIIAEIKEFYDDQEEIAIKEFLNLTYLISCKILLPDFGI